MHPAIKRLIEAAKPFTDGRIVDETSATIPLMEELQSAIGQVEIMEVWRQVEEAQLRESEAT